MRLLYNSGIYLTNAAIRLAALFNPKARLWVRGRKGIFDKLARTVDSGADIAWFHAASLGEFEQGRPVIEAFRKACPGYKILVTFFSPSGYEIRKNYPGADYIFYLPPDTPRNVRRFMAIVRPKIAVFVKYEFWVNYLLAMKRAGTKLYLISSIFRDGQIFFRPYGGLFRSALRAFRQIFVQNDSSRNLLKSIGIEQVCVAGDTRFDRVYEIAQQAKRLPEIERFAADAPVFIAGSTWPPDEELLVGLIERYPDVKFIVAPHEMDESRMARLAAEIKGGTLRYTQCTPHTSYGPKQLLILDTVGILSSVYSYATWSYIGGGFGVGIHNTLEAATFGLPVAFGPNYQKFKEARDLVTLGAARSINDYDELRAWFVPLRDNEEFLQKTSRIAKDYTTRHQGATGIIVRTIFN